MGKNNLPRVASFVLALVSLARPALALEEDLPAGEAPAGAGASLSPSYVVLALLVVVALLLAIPIVRALRDGPGGAQRGVMRARRRYLEACEKTARERAGGSPPARG